MRYVIVFIFLLSGLLSTAQIDFSYSVNTAGDNINNKDGSVSYSVGQMVYTTYTDTTGSVEQGVQQAYEISVLTSLNDELTISLDVSVYPNPTSNYLILYFQEVDQYATPEFMLYDTNGKTLLEQQIHTTDTQIDMSNYANATYFLKVIVEGVATKTFRIIKT